MSQTATLRRPAAMVLADLLPGTVVRDILLVAGAAGFVGALAQISIPLSFTPVPVTGQTLGCWSRAPRSAGGGRWAP
jgi:biotin transport system substrate-specific component